VFDDLRQTIRKFRNEGDRTSIGACQNLLSDNFDLLYITVFGLTAFGVIHFQDAVLLMLYSLVPFILDGSLFIEWMPLLSRLLPRATVVIELGGWIGPVPAAISLSLVYAVYKRLGALRINIPYYLSLKD